MRWWQLDQRGTAAIEFAIISVPLFVLAIGIVDFGRTLYTKNDLVHAADTGARLILIDNGAADADVTAVIRDSFRAGPSGDVAITLGTGTDGSVDYRTIELGYDVKLITPFIIARSITLGHERRVPLD